MADPPGVVDHLPRETTMTIETRTLARLVGVALLVSAVAAAAVGCDRKNAGSGTANPGGAAADAGPVVDLLFVYGSEKQAWVDAVTAEFNAAKNKVASGATIRVSAKAMGSGESKDDLLAGRVQADVWSPASSLFVTLANAEARTKGEPLVGPTQELVLSPVVIAMWKPMAEALGWPGKPLGWADVIELAKKKNGWAAYGQPQFGRFKFGHTHPEYSNSGLISVVAEVYAAAGKQKGLTPADVAAAATGDYVQAVERTVVHYGRSTGFFGKRLADSGPGYLSAAVVYESTVIESYGLGDGSGSGGGGASGGGASGGVPLVAIYPKEGTIWSDHPVAAVNRPWVTPEKREAAKAYIEFLRAAPQQKRALAFGFRPAEGELGAPIDAAHGVDPKQPATILEQPGADVTTACIELWRQKKKPSNVALVFDKSGSMKEENRMAGAKRGAKELINLLGPADRLTLVPFSTDVSVGSPQLVGPKRARLLSQIDQLYPEGGTNLYQAVRDAYNAVDAAAAVGDHIDAIVVLTDGEDNGKSVKLDEVLQLFRQNAEAGGVRVFAIGYGKSAKLDDLKRMAREAKGDLYTGDAGNILNVFRDIATFF
jgi:Ca-activated chloride channel family protein